MNVRSSFNRPGKTEKRYYTEVELTPDYFILAIFSGNPYLFLCILKKQLTTEHTETTEEKCAEIF
jgi:hypothetical protein